MYIKLFHYLHIQRWSLIVDRLIDEIGGYAQHETSEDLDISWRIREKRYKLYLASKATAYHRDPITFGGIWMREYNIGKREYFLAKQHTSHALSFKRILRFYPIILPIMLIIFFIFFWPIIPIILFLSFIPPLILLKSRLLTRITAWLTFNIMNFAYCTGFILSFLEKK